MHKPGQSMYFYEDNGARDRLLSGVRRVVVKVGTRLLTGTPGFSKSERIAGLVAQISGLRSRGLEVILVSSGAIGAGMAVLNTAKRPASLPQLQAHAAVGQCRLMHLYEEASRTHGFHCGQLLLTAADVRSRERHLNMVNCIEALLGDGVLPVINENDSVSVDEIKFGDNDILAALVATMVRADLTILLTGVDGLEDRRPESGPRRVSVVAGLTPEVLALAGGTDDSQLSKGGMQSKLEAARRVTMSGEHLWIADGSDFGVLEKVFAGTDTGTVFTAGKNTRMKQHKRYLAFFSAPAGDIQVDAGAEQALVGAGGSLLASGITAVAGSFSRGDTVRIVNQAGYELARGISNYDTANLERIRGRKTAEISGILGQDGYDEVIHRNYLVVTAAAK